MAAEIALVLCPTFTLGTPPLSLACLQRALRDAGCSTVVFDLDFALMREDARAFRELYRVYNIGHFEDVQRVQFVVRPSFSLMALFPEAFGEAATAPYRRDLDVIAGTRSFLERWATELLRHDPRVLMCSVYASNLLPTLLLAQAVKSRAPEVHVVAGGPGVGLPETQDFVLELGFVDICTTGEGEEVAPRLARALLDHTDERGLPGIAGRRGRQRFRAAPPPLIDLDRLRTPDFTGFPLPGHDVRHYRSNPNLTSRWYGVALPVASTRGCVRRCTFCAEHSYWRRYRLRSPEAVVDEIAELKERWGVRLFQFCDSLLNGSRKWLDRFSDLVAPLDVEFAWAYFRPTGLDREILEKVKAAGFRLLYFGTETASQALIDAADKGTTVEEIESVVMDTLSVGLHADITVLCGFPGESLDRFMTSVRFVRRLLDRVDRELGPAARSRLSVDAGSIVRVEPYSRLFTDAARFGIRLTPLSPDLPQSLAYLAGPLSVISIAWQSDVDPSEKQLRSELLQSFVHEEPSVDFRADCEDYGLEPDTVLRFADGSLRILRGEGGEVFLADATRLRARVNELTARLWKLTGQGLSIREVAAALAEETGKEMPVGRVIGVFERLLADGFVFVDDFGPEGVADVPRAMDTTTSR